jgi:UDP-N-acetylglucosamine--N-acetylmuramyl-(pentapeptide) pyrophosphoryl-undecaprenol N-acetylglucosamine transferase
MQLPDKLKVILSGGGTGGHIYPALAIANAIREAHQNVDILFVGAEGRMEMEKIPAAGYAIRGLKIRGIQRKFSFSNLLVPIKVLNSMYKAYTILRDFQPHIVIGTGGYASGPVVRVASIMGIPTIIQEQNSYPGITNQVLSGRAKKICVAYPGMEKYFKAEKIEVTGNPVRHDIEHLMVEKSSACQFFGLKPDKLTLLVIGGSLGARTLNFSIKEGLARLAERDIQLIWQTGKPYREEAMKNVAAYANRGMIARPFIAEMDRAYAAADIVVSRAGAIAISELCATGKPCILVPSPNVAEDHQTKNAKALTSRDAAILVSDKEAPDVLITKALQLAEDKGLRDKLSENILKMAVPDAAGRIAKIALELAIARHLATKKEELQNDYPEE